MSAAEANLCQSARPRARLRSAVVWHGWMSVVVRPVARQKKAAAKHLRRGRLKLIDRLRLDHGTIATPVTHTPASSKPARKLMGTFGMIRGAQTARAVVAQGIDAFPRRL